ncbi:MAG TPA: polysaccharide deacetylase family protein, partial [Chloroflexia bacterium]|nr:polysaccharide deacetylase family protein [Chloroflexia bacterium]
GARWNALYTGNVSVPAEAARRAGGFDAAIAYGEDVAFGYALHEQGLPFVYAPEAVVSTRNPKDAAALLRDFSGLAAGSLALYRSHPGSLPGLPLAAYGATNLRMRLVRGGLLRVSRLPGAAHLIGIAFRIWAAGAGWGRLDRPLFELARGYYYWRGVRAAATRREWSRLAQWGVPILLYHSVSPRVPGSPDRYSVTPRRFALHLRVLRLLGYRIVPLEHLLAGWDAGLLPPRRVAAITFDDGYRDNRTHAWPILRQAGAASTVFVVSGHVGGSNAWDADNPVPGRRLVTWEELRGMDRAGFRAEAHSVSHPDLNTLEPAQLDSEIAGCRRNLEQQLNRAVTMFAYPYGHHSPVVRDRVAAAGYRHAFTVQPGLNTPATPPLAHPRLDIHGSDGLLHFMLHLWTGDDPLQYVPQLLHRGTARVIRRVLRAPEGSQ